MQEKLNQEPQMMEHPDYAQELLDIVRGDLPVAEKRERLADYHENDLAEALEMLTDQERQAVYKLLDEQQVSEVFSYLEDAGDYLAEMDAEQAADIVENMDADDAVDALDTLDETTREDIIRRMEPEARKDVHLIQSYDEDEIGSRMTTNYIAIRRSLTVKQAMRALVEQAADNDNLSTIYVLEEDGKFYGAIGLQSLIIARDYTDLESLITVSYPYVYDHEAVGECIEQLKDYSEDSIPVLDSAMRLLGVITSQDLVEVVDEEMGDDYAKLAGMTEESDLNETLFQSLKKRVPWLVVLMGLGLVVSTVVSAFEPVMAQLTLVVAFQSMILDMAGNVGTQSLAVTIRVLMDEELSGREKGRLVLKEGRIGLATGLLLGACSFVLVGLYVFWGKGQALGASFAISGCIGISLMAAMVISSLTGTVVPIFFKKIHIDPAVASGPLITTINDLVAVVTYYGLVWLMLLEWLHLGG